MCVKINVRRHLSRGIELLGYRVIASPSPWMTTKDAPNGKPRPLDSTMFAKCFQSILRTGRRKTTRRRKEWRYSPSIKVNRERKKKYKQTMKLVVYFLSQRALLIHNRKKRTYSTDKRVGSSPPLLTSPCLATSRSSLRSIFSIAL